MSSRFFEELREKRGLCYDVHTSIKRYDETGAFFVYAGIDNRKVEETVSVISEQLIKIKKHAVSEDELVRAKEFYKGQLLLAFEDTGARMLWLGDKVMTEKGIPSVKALLKEVDAITALDIKDTAAGIFLDSTMNLAVIGPADSLDRGRISKALELT